MSKLHFTSALAVGALCAWWWIALPGKDGVAQAPQPQRAPAAAEPSLHLSVPERELGANAADLFAPPPAPPPPRVQVVAPAAPPPPQAPPLPYRYNGSGMWQGKPIVFLLRGDKTFMVSAGDTLEGTYAVEALERNQLVLRYLPLAIRQVLPYEGGAQLPVEVAATPNAAPQTGQTLTLQVETPAEVILGDEFVVTLVLPGAGGLKATVEVGYDHEVLRMVGPGVRSAGRAVVDMASGSTGRAQLRFKVLTESPTSTDIQLQFSAMNASGKHVPVSVPSAQTVSLVQPGGGG
jgi:hypothetical protein